MEKPSLANGDVVDLSLTLASELPASWPGAVPFRHFTEHWFKEESNESQIVLCNDGGPYRSHLMILDEHSGTHFDAPAHFVPPSRSGLPNASHFGDVSGEVVPLDQFRGRSRILDARHIKLSEHPGESVEVDLGRVVEWERETRSLEGGDVVLLLTGWDKRYVRGPAGRSYVHNSIVSLTEPAWPAFTPAAMGYLADSGVRCVGTDAPSMGAAHDAAPTHLAGLGRGMVFVECLANLDLILDVPSIFMFAPVKVARSSGGPGRAYAVVGA
ncbi:cyclase family protein [Pseudolysinimonas yzui]|uniref:Cyclase family protein n=1 Tax=Pseudolysinimonas yzui TaxID=2708254 RepID=A0A8J3GSY0_9MICO|nr:hypothetical protein GCM10011600_29580 [Pseudolysinimonas yzui]